MICRVCGEEFSPSSKHPGYINVCLDSECREKAKKETKVMTLTAKMMVAYDK